MKDVSDDPFDGLLETEPGRGSPDSRHDVDEEDLTPALEDVDVLNQVVILIRKVGLERLVDACRQVVNRHSPTLTDFIAGRQGPTSRMLWDGPAGENLALCVPRARP